MVGKAIAFSFGHRMKISVCKDELSVGHSQFSLFHHLDGLTVHRKQARRQKRVFLAVYL
jgi:hypothetical protein